MPHIAEGIHKNTKTYRSFDPVTVCKRQEDGEPCLYCYVQAGRDTGFCAKKVVRDPFEYEGFVSDRMTDAHIEKLNKLGGIRMFSYGDYFPSLDDAIQKFLDDCLEEGLDVKAITKEPEFIEKFHDHEALKMIHVSVDFLTDVECNSGPISLEEAHELSTKYDKVLIRGVFLNNSYIDKHAEDVDIITLNHAIFNSPDELDVHLFTKEERRELGQDYAGKVCASGPSGKCKDCPVKCGCFVGRE